jgi:pimeloyl-ACP methyl ester carboxylesterase
MYEPIKRSSGFFLSVRGLRYFVRTWGEEGAPPLLLLHGGQDGSATFQFMIDCFARDWRIAAPDWRGHGKTEHASQGYIFNDYAADLDGLLEALFPNEPATIVGHSLGGNAGAVYGGVRPERVKRLISLDGFGLPDRKPEEAPKQLGRWLESWRAGVRQHKPYQTLDETAARLIEANPKLDLSKALFLASELSTKRPDGTIVWAFDPRLRAPNSILYRQAEWAACVALCKAPTLFVGSGRPFPPSLADEPGGVEARAALVPGSIFKRIDGTGHNLHHDEPFKVAQLVEDFLTGS